jgi:hypothetical protein
MPSPMTRIFFPTRSRPHTFRSTARFVNRRACAGSRNSAPRRWSVYARPVTRSSPSARSARSGASVPSRRRSTIKSVRTLAREMPKSVELEQRVSRVELHLQELTRRVAALQAQLDHLVAKVRV